MFRTTNQICMSRYLIMSRSNDSAIIHFLRFLLIWWSDLANVSPQNLFVFSHFVVKPMVFYHPNSSKIKFLFLLHTHMVFVFRMIKILAKMAHLFFEWGTHGNSFCPRANVAGKYCKLMRCKHCQWTKLRPARPNWFNRITSFSRRLRRYNLMRILLTIGIGIKQKITYKNNFTQVVFQVINYIHISYPPKVNMATNKARM